MRTFHMTAGLDFKAVIPDSFVKFMREQAQDTANRTEFLKHAQETYPEDDEEFILCVLKNGVRLGLRDSLRSQFAQSGLGLTLSPARVQPNLNLQVVPALLQGKGAVQPLKAVLPAEIVLKVRKLIDSLEVGIAGGDVHLNDEETALVSELERLCA